MTKPDLHNVRRFSNVKIVESLKKSKTNTKLKK